MQNLNGFFYDQELRAERGISIECSIILCFPYDTDTYFSCSRTPMIKLSEHNPIQIIFINGFLIFSKIQ